MEIKNLIRNNDKGRVQLELTASEVKFINNILQRAKWNNDPLTDDQRDFIVHFEILKDLMYFGEFRLSEIHTDKYKHAKECLSKPETSETPKDTIRVDELWKSFKNMGCDQVEVGNEVILMYEKSPIERLVIVRDIKDAHQIVIRTGYAGLGKDCCTECQEFNYSLETGIIDGLTRDNLRLYELMFTQSKQM